MALLAPTPGSAPGFPFPALPKAAPSALPAKTQDSSLRVQAQNQGEFTVWELWSNFPK